MSANSTADRIAATKTASACGQVRHDEGSLIIGRFAPSPSGPLHFGSLVSALASFLDAKSQGGHWLLRIDDLDTPRSQPGSEDAILATLTAHALHWDGAISRQSDNLSDYASALGQLADKGLLFFCNCSRKSLRGIPVYPGTCRANACTPNDLDEHLDWRANANQERPAAIRLCVPDLEIHCVDELQGASRTQLRSDSGDYVVFRRDGLFSYQLAVVVDDALTGVNRVVRGADLLPTTARQQHLHSLLGFTPPAWLHLPVLLNERQTKLSKQAHSLAVDDHKPATNIDIALQLLGQNPPTKAHAMPTAELIRWAIANWQPKALPASETFSTFVGW